jgi:hypothetical protein
MPISKWPKKTFSKNFQNTKKEIYTLENKMEIITKCNTFISKTQKTKTSSIQNVKNDIITPFLI